MNTTEKLKQKREAGITEEQERAELYAEIDGKYNEMMKNKEKS